MLTLYVKVSSKVPDTHISNLNVSSLSSCPAPFLISHLLYIQEGKHLEKTGSRAGDEEEPGRGLLISIIKLVVLLLF